MPRVAASAPGALPRRAPLAGVVVLLAACAVAPRPPEAGARASAPPAAPAAASRFVHALPDAGFWVTHDDALDRIVAAGARLELTPSGQVLRAAWEEDRGGGGEVIVGSIAAPEAQGGGFVHWTRSRLLRSRAFTGPVELLAVAGEGLRGVRPGLDGLWVITDAGPRALVDGGRRLGPFADPGLADAVAADPARAIRLDVFGRSAATFDGGRSWIDLTPSAGIAARAVSAEEGELGVETWQGRFAVGPRGKLAPLDSSPRGGAPPKPFQLAWKGSRADRAASTFDYRELSPLQAAVMSGAAAGDGTAFGVTEGTLARVELATGRLVSASRDGLESGLECQALPEGGDVLLACVWNRFQSAGAYLLRSRGGALPVIERAFTEEGTFVADEDGGLGYTGSCAVKPRLDDPDDTSGREELFEYRLGPTLCVRRAPERPGDAATWIERAVEVPVDATIAAWIPRRDGTATALLTSGAALPEPPGAARAREQGGVRVVRVDRAIEGFRWKTSLAQMARDGGRTIDQRFTARADGLIDAWLSPNDEGPTPIWLGVTVASDGTATPHPLPPEAAAMVVTGAFGAAISERGQLFETVDHGRSWRAAGTSPLPPSAAATGGCSALGCALGPLVRLGWGEAAGLAVDVTAAVDPPPAAPPPLPRIVCGPAGSPIPEVPPAPLPAALRQSIPTPWGEPIDLAHERGAPEAKAPPAPPPPSGSAPPPRRAPPTPRGGIFALADKPTHTLLFRPPLAPFAAVKRVDVVAPGFSAQRRLVVTPLLGAGGAVEVLLGGEGMELVIAGDHAAVLPAFETRRYGGSGDGLSAGVGLGGGRALLLGEVRRRLTLEEHRAPPPPPLFLGADREALRRRPLTLGRRDDGALGVLVFDGAAPESVAVGPLDPRGAGVLPLVKLAPWSTLTSGGDPRCLAADPGAYRALVVVDASAWLALDPRALPGVTLGPRAIVEVRWGRERVCLAAVDAAVNDARRRGDGSRTLRLVARWDGRGAPRSAVLAAPNGALRAAEYRQDLRCAVAPPEAAR